MADGSEARARATYDTVARAYDEQLRDELAGKAVDRGLLAVVAELAGGGPLVDVGCGPGHVTRFLAGVHPDVAGVDLSPAMIELAGQRAPGLEFTVASMLDLPVGDAAWAGAVAMYSIIHLTDDERPVAFGELARVLRVGGVLLVAFHVDSAEFATGEVNHLTMWFGHRVELDGRFLDPARIAAELDAAGFAPLVELRREPIPDVEYPSRRAYLLVRRR